MPQVHPRHQHAWRASRRLQGNTGVTRSPITYPYRPSTPFLLLASAPHTVDLPSPPAFRLPHPRPRSPVGTPTPKGEGGSVWSLPTGQAIPEVSCRLWRPAVLRLAELISLSRPSLQVRLLFTKQLRLALFRQTSPCLEKGVDCEDRAATAAPSLPPRSHHPPHARPRRLLLLRLHTSASASARSPAANQHCFATAHYADG